MLGARDGVLVAAEAPEVVIVALLSKSLLVLVWGRWGKVPLSPTFRYRMGRQANNTCDQSKTGKKFEDIFEICLQMAFINCRSQTNVARGN